MNNAYIINSVWNGSFMALKACLFSHWCTCVTSFRETDNEPLKRLTHSHPPVHAMQIRAPSSDCNLLPLSRGPHPRLSARCNLTCRELRKITDSSMFSRFFAFLVFFLTKQANFLSSFSKLIYTLWSYKTQTNLINKLLSKDPQNPCLGITI